ncbi:glycoprotein-N-acetylgalactosamine 3-beta-galactosyltransferase 1-like [Haliotis rufescens]|uniref:glycoprotein-N-acetylgalactosamine 3-beta-galactosyltransferase 1-like n=1 Tax=Haliotis rufescens TaxID=6454 RepID=UPI00201F62E3|nr:glycoprotein-N-acetylgalactosamine 3-beta-galactosyltransferase 1-like [Haliotis rufescens]
MRVYKIFNNFVLRLAFTSRLTLVVYGFVLGFVTMVIVLPHLASNRNTGLMKGKQLQEDTLERLLSEEKRSDGGDDRLARAVLNRTRILCWVMIRDGGNVKARALRATWGKRCDKLLFFGIDDEFAAIDLRTQEGKRFLAAKTFTCLKYIHKYHLNDADWFLKADDDTYIVMENLKYFLSEENPELPIYFGEFFNPYDTKYLRYNSGGAGYVLSREALRRYGELALLRSVCADPGGPEDKEIGYCLRQLGVEIGDTTDRFGKSRFHYDRADLHAVGDVKQWYRDFMGARYRRGTDTMSDYPVSFHYLQHYDIHIMEFVLYRLRPHGVVKSFKEVNVV